MNYAIPAQTQAKWNYAKVLCTLLYRISSRKMLDDFRVENLRRISFASIQYQARFLWCMTILTNQPLTMDEDYSLLVNTAEESNEELYRDIVCLNFTSNNNRASGISCMNFTDNNNENWIQTSGISCLNFTDDNNENLSRTLGIYCPNLTNNENPSPGYPSQLSNINTLHVVAYCSLLPFAAIGNLLVLVALARYIHFCR